MIIFILVWILIATILIYAKWSFRQQYAKDIRKYVLGSGHNKTELLGEHDIAHLPDPVKKYLRYSQSIGKPKVFNFKVAFTGRLRKTNTAPWMSFSSEQYNNISVPTRLFFLRAIMKSLPVAGYHFYRNGQASMDIRLFSLIKVQYQSGKEMGIAETVTFFNDMCCVAPATLVDPRINWVKTEENAVLAQFTTDGISISAWLHFNEEGALTNFISDDRYALEDGHLRRMRWSTPMKNYREIDGFRLGTSAETIYHYPEGDFCYGTFSMVGIQCNV